MYIYNIDKKNIIILGLGISGLEILKELLHLNCTPIVVDDIIKKLPAKFQDIKLYKTKEFLKLKNKVDIIFKSPGVKYNHEVIVNFPNAIITNDIELSYLKCQDMNTKIIGVTGTNGKTSTTSLITHLLNLIGKKAKSCGNIGISPLEILREKNVDYLVMELSSFQLKSIEKFRCDYAFLLNISPDHLDFHESIEDYINSKMKIIKNTPTNKKIYTGCELSDVKINIFRPDNFEIYKDCEHCGVSKENLELIYEFSKDLGISKELFVEATKTLKPIPHRVEFVAKKNGIEFYNDSKATNVEATKMALLSLNNIVLLVGGYDKKEDLTILKKYLENVKQVIAFGSNRKKFSFVDGVVICETLHEAYQNAVAIAIENDVVLLSPACASYDQFSDYQERGNLFKKLVLGEA